MKSEARRNTSLGGRPTSLREVGGADVNAVEAFLERRTAIYWVPDAAPLLPHGRPLVVPFVSLKEKKAQ